MKYIFSIRYVSVIAAFLLVALSVFLIDNFRVYKGMLQHKLHFELHKNAFALIGDELETDNIVTTTSYCPAHPSDIVTATERFIFKDTPEGREAEKEWLASIERDAVYQPLLKDLKYNDCMLLSKISDGKTIFSNVGYADRIAAYAQYVHWPEGVGEVLSCDKGAQESGQGSCSEVLAENWTLTYRWGVD